ncbi:hypothetical protein O6P43_029277 [Quillaja saponaria]|uniref:Uncharacterized protein n=1 Tax=Quillaja saponaria TaxID=32244 RepID=A0AAD7PB85_QUISA|nr:hypothetical protein O6P43_029277 [Quillaja saponaria]
MESKTSALTWITKRNGTGMKEEYIREVSEKYGEDSDAHPSFDPDIWLKVTGGVQKGGKVYGCGTPGAARALFGDKINSSLSSLRSTATLQPDVASAERIHTLEQQLEYQKRKTDEMSNIMKVMMDKLGLDPSILGGLQDVSSSGVDGDVGGHGDGEEILHEDGNNDDDLDDIM